MINAVSNTFKGMKLTLKHTPSLTADPHHNLHPLPAFEDKKVMIYRTGETDSSKNTYISAFLVPVILSPRNFYLSNIIATFLSKSNLFADANIIDSRIVIIFKPKFWENKYGRNEIELK
jgi:hypothetical protein